MTISLRVPSHHISDDEDDLLRSPTSEAPLLEPSPLSPEPKQPKPWIYLVVCFCILVALIDLGAYVYGPPQLRLYESILCLRHYQENDPSKIHNGTVDESLCKINAVQDTLAMILGWQDLWDSIPAILLAIPYGALADKHGRKWIFVMSLVGLIMTQIWIMFICYFQFNLKLVWFSSAFLLFGGGTVVASAIGITMISDICPPERRTTIFLYFQAIILIAELVAPIVSSLLMIYGNWVPMLGGVAVECFAITFAVVVPETLHLRDSPEPNLDIPEHHESGDASKKNPYGLEAQMQHLRDAVRFLKRDLSLALVVFSFLVNRIGRQAILLLLRYASKRYNWSLRKASLLLSLRAATNLISLVIITPAVSLWLLKSLKFSPQRTDLFIARGCIVVTAIAYLVMGLAVTPALLIIGLILYNFGTGFTAALRSVAIFMIGGQSSPDIARLFAVIAIMEGLGSFISGPLLALLFRWGMQLGSAFLGIPFLFSGLIFAVIGFITSMITLRDLNTERVESEVLNLQEDVGHYRDAEEEVDDPIR